MNSWKEWRLTSELFGEKNTHYQASMCSQSIFVVQTMLKWTNRLINQFIVDDKVCRHAEWVCVCDDIRHRSKIKIYPSAKLFYFFIGWEIFWKVNQIRSNLLLCLRRGFFYSVIKLLRRSVVIVRSSSQWTWETRIYTDASRIVNKLR